MQKTCKYDDLKKNDFESVENANLIIDIKKFKAEIEKEMDKLDKLNDLVSELNNQLIV